ncbi:sensor histidine kinase [Nonomuraea sp. NPDC059023]|uniref:sensor histidine kinase n=1 Tax=unclassified Nonomuraea TaxID=2593643 RepID=UPI00367781CC
MVTAGVLTGWLLNAAVNVVNQVWGSVDGLGVWTFVACMAVAFGLQVAHSFGRPWLWRPAAKAASLGTLAVVVLAPTLWIGPSSLHMLALLAASVLLVAPLRLGWPLFALVCAAGLAFTWAYGLGAVSFVYALAYTPVTGLALYGISFLATRAETLEHGRRSLALVAAARERVRIARDLHDVVGHDLLAFTLKNELAHRLLPGSPQQAEAVLSEALLVARRATAELRTIPLGDQQLSLSQEITSIESTLSAAQIDVHVSASIDGLTHAVDCVLAVVLREAVTNVLRHSKARQCTVQADVLDGVARLSVANDGVGAEDLSTSGSGLDNLASRLASFAGRLKVKQDHDWFRLTAEITLSDLPPEASAGRADQAKGASPGPNSPVWAPAAVHLLTLAVVLGYIPILVTNMLWRSPQGFTAGVGICLAVLLATQLAHTFLGPAGRSAPISAATLTLQAVATFLPLVWMGALWGSMAGFLAGSILLLLRGVWRWGLFAAVGAVVLALGLAIENDTVLLAHFVLSTLYTGLILYGLASLSTMVAESHRMRGEIVRLAQAQERLGAAHKVNDLLDRDLSMIMWTCGEARRIAAAEPQRAQEHTTDVLVAARKLVAEVRSLASGYRHVSLAKEIESSRAALRAAGIDFTVEVTGDEIVGENDVAAAMVLRDAVTMLVQLRGVTECVIKVSSDVDTVRLRVSHDGPLNPGDDSLTQVRSRAEAINGTLRTTTEAGWCHVTAELPAGVGTGRPAAAD